MLPLQGSVESQLAALVERYHLAMIILTRGAHGSILMNASEISVHQGIKARIVDTIGAGDSFTAMATLGYLQGLSLDEINHQANMLAAFVCSRQGAMPDGIASFF
jgi:fructokinase